MNEPTASYPATLSIDYPDRPLNRVSSAFRIFTFIPIAVVLGALTTITYNNNSTRTINGVVNHYSTTLAATSGILFVSVLLMILFRQKYPRWWFDWNLMFTRFSTRVSSYLALLRDEYPSTEEEQSVHLNLTYPDAQKDINRWMPLVKWFLAIPHYFVLIGLAVAAVVVVIVAWFAIIFTGRYPRGAFDFIVGAQRWALRVSAYAFLLITDIYPPFTLS